MRRAIPPESGSRPQVHGASAPVAGLRAIGRALLGIPRRRAWIPVVLWMALIGVLSELRGRPGGGSETWKLLHNLAHAPLFGLLGLWVVLLLPREVQVRAGPAWPRVDWRAGLRVVAAVGVYAIVDELHQATTVGRDASVLDLLTDVTGAACVVWVAAYVGRPRAAAAGLLGRLAVSTGLCLVAAALATWLPAFFGGVAWM